MVTCEDRGRYALPSSTNPLLRRFEMSKVAAVNFNPKIVPHLQHNDRTNSRADNIYKDLSSLNECDVSAIEAFKRINKLYNDARDNYRADLISRKGNTKGIQNFTKKERSFHEAIFEINDKTTMSQCQELADRIAILTGFTKIQISIHRDEGHKENNGEFKTHNHAHAVFFTLDKKTGKQLARFEASLCKGNLSKIQDIASEVLQMKRGNEYFKNSQPSPQYLKNHSDYVRFKKQELNLDSKYQNIALELTQRYQKLILKENEYQHSLKDLKSLELSLNHQKKDIQSEYRKIRIDYGKSFEILEQNYTKRLNFFKNAFSFGKHNRKLRQDYQRDEKLLTMCAKTAEEQANIKNLELQKQLQEIQEHVKNLENHLKKAKEDQELYAKRNYQLAKEIDQKNELIKKLAPREYQNISQKSHKQALNQSKSRGR